MTRYKQISISFRLKPNAIFSCGLINAAMSGRTQPQPDGGRMNMTQKKFESRVARSTEEMAAMVTHLTTLSCWFEVTPLPDDNYEVTVKADVAHVAFPEMKPYSVLLMRLDYSEDPEEYTGFMHVIAASVAGAESAAVAKFDDMDGASPYGYSILLVLEGHHTGLNAQT